MNELKIIIWGFIWIILGEIVLMSVMHLIATKIKNKAQKRKSRQVTCQKPKKTFKPENFISNYHAFIEENTKGMTLFEIKEFKRAVELELTRMIG